VLNIGGLFGGRANNCAAPVQHEPGMSDAAVSGRLLDIDEGHERELARRYHEFVMRLRDTTGHDASEWLAALAAHEFADRNAALDWLCDHGFEFAQASWLERTLATGAALFGVDQSVLSHRLRDAGRGAFVRSVAQHAELLHAFLRDTAALLPRAVSARALQHAHALLCSGRGWPQRPWNPIAAALCRLMGGRKTYPWVEAPNGTRRRLRYYVVELAAASATGSAAPVGTTRSGADDLRVAA